MSNPIPSLLALTSIADGSPRIAAPVRNNYSAIQTAVNELITALSGGSAGQILEAASGNSVQWINGAKTTTSLMSGGPPGSPTDGDIWIATAVDTGNLATTAGVNWTFRYNNSSGSASKWEFIGGVPLYAEVPAQETRTNNAYGALTTAGPSITLPRAGDYDVTIGAMLGQDGGSSSMYMSYDIGGTGAVDADALFMQGGTGSPVYASGSRTRRKTGLTAVTLTAKYRTAGAGQGEAANRFMSVLPVRIS